MRDLDRIREVREFRVTGPQLTSLFVYVLLLVSTVFAIGFELGRLRSPVDLALLEPLGKEDQNAGTLLAEMLAEKEQHALTSTAAAQPAAEDRRGDKPTPTLSASDVLEGGAPSKTERPEALVTSDPVTPSDFAGVANQVAALEVVPRAQVPAPSKPVLEVVERSFPEEQPTPEPKPVALAVVEAPVPDPPVIAAPEEIVSMPAPPAGRGYTVQVGAFESADDARLTIASLQRLGHDAFHVSATVNGTVYHRVRVGLYSSKDEATEAAERLQGATPHGTYVTEQP